MPVWGVPRPHEGAPALDRARTLWRTRHCATAARGGAGPGPGAHPLADMTLCRVRTRGRRSWTGRAPFGGHDTALPLGLAPCHWGCHLGLPFLVPQEGTDPAPSRSRCLVGRLPPAVLHPRGLPSGGERPRARRADMTRTVRGGRRRPHPGQTTRHTTGWRHTVPKGDWRPPPRLRGGGMGQCPPGAKAAAARREGGA